MGERLNVELTQDDLSAINNALNEVCNGPGAVPEWEFHARMGVERSEALETMKRVRLLLDQAG